MALQQRELDGIGLVTFQKRRANRSIRIHIHGGDIKVTMPHFVPYRQAEAFVKSRKDWINKNRGKVEILRLGSFVGKNHVVSIQPGKTIRTRITSSELVLTLPSDVSITNQDVQKKLKSAAERALKIESNDLLGSRLSDLAYEHGFEFTSVHYKKMKTRWGSCDQANNLIFNIYLIQLPWDIINYVIIHELAHTLHHNHSKDFWKVVENCLPDYKEKRKVIKKYQSLIVVL